MSMGLIASKVGLVPERKGLNRVHLENEMYEPVVVLELFTSQGCSSCPAADILLQKVKKEYQNKVFALSYHVDYWNYIGWKDPFSEAKYGKKQREYNIKFRNNSNYTPQLVVNGKEHFVGSSVTKMYDMIAAYKKKKSVNAIAISNVSINAKEVSFSYSVQGGLKNKNIRTLLVLDERVTEVKRGENRNKTLRNSNVVVAERITTIDEMGAVSITIPKIVANTDQLNLIVLVETSNYDISAAAKQSIIRY